MHIVDSSVLPSLPAGPVALTMMANAHRIASECPIGYAA
jgi:choline dehydrogenase-like flavoprotein